VKIRTKIAAVAVGTCALVMVAAPAHAQSAPSVGVNITDAPGVTGICGFVASLPSTDIHHITFALKYTVTATGPAFATNGVCEVLDEDGVSYGRVTAAGVGPVAEGAGTVTVPADIVGPQVCNTPHALYLDGTEANSDNVQKCRAI
jgi:hypothetical protein